MSHLNFGSRPRMSRIGVTIDGIRDKVQPLRHNSWFPSFPQGYLLLTGARKSAGLVKGGEKAWEGDYH